MAGLALALGSNSFFTFLLLELGRTVLFWIRSPPSVHISVSCNPVTPLSFVCRGSRTFSAAATQAALIALVDVKLRGWLPLSTLCTEIKLHNAPPCLEMPNFKPAELEKEPELIHSRRVLCALNNFRVIDVDDSRLSRMRINSLNFIAKPVYSYRFAHDGFLVYLLCCKSFIFANKSEFTRCHQTISSSDLLRSVRPIVKQIKSQFVWCRYGPPYRSGNESL